MKNRIMLEERIDVRIPRHLQIAIEREAESRCVSVSSLVRAELARALLRNEATAQHNEPADPSRAVALDTD